ncbi:hypothetical protein [Streptomyces luteolus]|uniref:Integral membrane protein n=1 Tax=Streptomyces luteolus TaxID=3043615 RepID=A0ABT6SZQ1_9ACTN|nr:hypothetical protein [Streptomyces sp. B-S-A12]MDI3421083.1 hypothetical protein [Streptomyces sp. B-S-A12]
MGTRGEQPYENDVLEQIHRARAARRGMAAAAAVLALLGPAVVWLRVARGAPWGWWIVPCGAALLLCVGAAGLARFGRTKRALAMILAGLALVLTGDLLATAAVT